MTILTSVMQFAMLPLQGLGQGAQPIISYNYGAGDAGRVKEAFKKLVQVSLIYAAILWILVMAAPQVLRGALYGGRGTNGIYSRSAPGYHGGGDSFRNSDRLPDDIYRLGKSERVQSGSHYAKIYPVASAYLHYAAYLEIQSDYGGLPGGAGGRSAGSYLYCDSVFPAVPKSVGEN